MDAQKVYDDFIKALAAEGDVPVDILELLRQAAEQLVQRGNLDHYTYLQLIADLWDLAVEIQAGKEMVGYPNERDPSANHRR